MTRFKDLGDGNVAFHCPGCGNSHVLPTAAGESPRWDWNGDLERPTLTPSILRRAGHYSQYHQADRGCWCTHNAEKIARGEEPSGFSCVICHSFVTDGRIQYLSDCTHALAGQTIDLPPYP